jgi:hypothetical protein
MKRYTFVEALTMARNLFTILDDLTTSLAELKASLAPLALIGGTVVNEAGKPATSPRPAASPQPRKKGAPSRARGPISPKRRAAMRDHGRYMGAISRLSAAKRAEVKKVRAAKGVEAAIARAQRLAR